MELKQYVARDVARLGDYPGLVAQLAEAYRAMAVAPLRIAITGDNGFELLAMPAVSAAYAGAKILTIVPDNDRHGLRTIDGLFVLFDVRTGRALAIMDASELTARRTAAVSALASRHLSRPDASSLLMIGSGHLIPYLAAAHAAVRPIERISIWARDADKAAACALRIGVATGRDDIEVVAALSEAIPHAAIISTATRSLDPLIVGDLLRPGTHVDAVGGYRPDMREVDDATIRRAQIFVDVREALEEAGDLISPIVRQVIGAGAVVGDLAAIVAGAGRRGPEEITLFKAVGSAASDLAAAEYLWNADRG